MQNLRFRLCTFATQLTKDSYSSMVLRNSRLLILNEIPRRYAGHSKWQNIKHTKAIVDAQRAKNIVKLQHKLHLAIKAGGGDLEPKHNIHIRHVFEEAQKAGLPMEALKRFLNSRKNKTQGEPQSEVWPLKAPGGAVLLVELLCQNPRKLHTELSYIIKKNRGMWLDGPFTSAFDCVGIIQCKDVKGVPASDDLLEQSTDHAIEAGADDVTLEESDDHGKVFEFTCAPTAVPKIKYFLIEAGYNCVFSEIVFIPRFPVEISEDQLPHIIKLHEKLLEHPEVVNVHDNIQMSQ